jgi:hypothetical protein
MAYPSYSVFLGLLLLLASSVLSIPPEEKRTKCHKDKIYRVLADPTNSPDAIWFCSTFASLPARTTTITATSPGGPTSTVYSPYTPPASTLYKRGEESAAPSLPPYVSQYPASRVYSACSCLNTPTTQTVTASTFFSTTPTATTTYPALCNPTNFLQYRGSDDPFEETEYRRTNAVNEQECCVSCFNTQNCLRFQYYPTNPESQQCQYQVAINPATPAERSDLCPLGVRPGIFLSAPLGTGSGFNFLNYGPCMDGAPLYGAPPMK